MHSEEVIKLNVALRYCDQLKNNLQASILHVQMLNRKYNTKDYSQSLLIYGSPRNEILLQQASDKPKKTNDEPKMKNKKQIRSLKEIKNNFNNIIVNGIKVRREVEALATQINLLGKEYQMDQPYLIKRRLQTLSHSYIHSPTECRNRRCFQNSSVVFGSRDCRHNIAHSLKKTRHSFSASSCMKETPKMKRAEQFFQSNLVMNKPEVTPNFNVNKITCQSTPIRATGRMFNSASNKSSFQSNSVMNNTSFRVTPNSTMNDKINSTTNSMIKTCFRNVSNSPKTEQLYHTPKRICWTPIVKKNFYLPMTC